MARRLTDSTIDKMLLWSYCGLRSRRSREHVFRGALANKDRSPGGARQYDRTLLMETISHNLCGFMCSYSAPVLAGKALLTGPVSCIVRRGKKAMPLGVSHLLRYRDRRNI